MCVTCNIHVPTQIFDKGVLCAPLGATPTSFLEGKVGLKSLDLSRSFLFHVQEGWKNVVGAGLKASMATVGPAHMLVVQLHLVEVWLPLYCYLQHFLRPPLLCAEML